jgi:hypothetical protein
LACIQTGSSIFQFDDVTQTCLLANGIEKTLEANPDLGPAIVTSVWMDKTIPRSRFFETFNLLYTFLNKFLKTLDLKVLKPQTEKARQEYLKNLILGCPFL